MKTRNHCDSKASRAAASPRAIDDFREVVNQSAPSLTPEFRSWILTLVEFDGDLEGLYA